MSDKQDSGQKPAEQPSGKEEAITGSGSVRKGADVLFTPPTEPVSDPTPMPVDIAPVQPADPAASVAPTDQAPAGPSDSAPASSDSE